MHLILRQLFTGSKTALVGSRRQFILVGFRSTAHPDHTAACVIYGPYLIGETAVCDHNIVLATAQAVF